MTALIPARANVGIQRSSFSAAAPTPLLSLVPSLAKREQSSSSDAGFVAFERYLSTD